MNTLTAPTLELPDLTIVDRCDQCHAQAFVAVTFSAHDVELLFCAHHYTRHAPAITDQGGTVTADTRDTINLRSALSARQ